MTPVVTVDQLTRSFGDICAVDRLSLQIPQGELFGLIGSDGAGKTTTIRMLTGVLDPSAGTATVLGHPCSDLESIRGDIGYMSQKFGLYPDLTVAENMQFHAEIFDVPKREEKERTERLLAAVNLSRFRDRKAGALSGGMKQKLGLACALIHTPKILFLDEPTNGVDPLSRREFWKILYELQNDGVTIFVATAYLDEADRCHRVGLLHNGRLLACDTPDNLRKTVSCSDHKPSLEDVFIAMISGTQPHHHLLHTNRQTAMQMTAAPPAVSVRALVKRFGSFTAVNGIDLDVPKGEIFGFLGPNGAGKSTTIKMLCGILEPTSGSGTVAGCDIRTGQEEIKKQIGYMSQKFSLYEELTVDENINFYGGIYRISGKRLAARAEWVIDMAGISERRKSLAGELSGGWKQRLALGCAMLHEPPVIFLDEPTAGVDPINRRAFWELIRLLAQGGTTVFVTTHYMDEAEYCDRLAMIHQGGLIALGSPTELKQQRTAPGAPLPSLEDIFVSLIEEKESSGSSLQ